jgi:kynurenine formamidase
MSWVEQMHRIVRRGAVYDLARPLFVGAPRYPTHPPYLYAMMKRHGDSPYAGGVSSATDMFTMSCHGGTHIDALCHFSLEGRLHGGLRAAEAQDLARGFAALDIPTLPLAPRRGLLLDVAAFRGVEALGPADVVTAEDLAGAAAAAGVEVTAGDAVLVRTGWGVHWPDPVIYSGSRGAPGVGLAAAEWMLARGAALTGSDTTAYEPQPSTDFPVHVRLLVKAGVPIVETLDLDALARDRVCEFMLQILPLPLRGATGSPIRPVAMV